MQNQNNVVFITGSSSGIGLGLARAFAAQKYRIILHGLDLEGGRLVNEFRDLYDVPTTYMQCDLRNHQDTVAKLSTAIDELGPVNILINNAGIQFVKPIEEFPEEKWQEILDVHLSSAFYLSKYVWTKMKAQKFGRIINIASVHGLRASEYKSAYVAAKHGLIGLTKALALEGASHGITVNAICPGYVKTPLVQKQIDDQALAHGISTDEVIEKVLLSKQPIKKFISIEAIAGLGFYLAGSDADTITGASFVLDGGWTAQ